MAVFIKIYKLMYFIIDFFLKIRKYLLYDIFMFVINKFIKNYNDNIAKATVLCFIFDIRLTLHKNNCIYFYFF
jgi:hypothetical protein